MNNASKLLSKHRIRKIIRDKTDIDIAGCSNEQSSREVDVTHTSLEDCHDSNTIEIVDNKNKFFCIK